MADALTETQIEILRAVRDGTIFTRLRRADDFFSDLSLLHVIGLINVTSPMRISLSDIGVTYLAQIEARLLT